MLKVYSRITKTSNKPTKKEEGRGQNYPKPLHIYLFVLKTRIVFIW